MVVVLSCSTCVPPPCKRITDREKAFLLLQSTNAPSVCYSRYDCPHRNASSCTCSHTSHVVPIGRSPIRHFVQSWLGFIFRLLLGCPLNNSTFVFFFHMATAFTAVPSTWNWNSFIVKFPPLTNIFLLRHLSYHAPSPLPFRWHPLRSRLSARYLSPYFSWASSPPLVMSTNMTSDRPPSFDQGPVFFLKAGPDGKSQGDCPFCMKAKLALELKGVPVQPYFINLANKPSWFLELTPVGSTPVLVDGNRILTDSGDIVKYADETGRIQDLVLMREDDPSWKEAAQVVAPIFASFVRLMKNKETENDPALAQELSACLIHLNRYLEKNQGPFLLDQVSALDCDLAPKLFHIMVAGEKYKGYKWPAHCDRVGTYLDAMRQTREWSKVCCEEEVVIWGWSKFF